LVVSIAGGGGAGKSQVAKAVVALLGDDIAARVPMDWYLVPRTVPMEDWLAQPLAWDWGAVEALLTTPAGETRLTPPFDFETFTRSEETGQRQAIPIRLVMVLDAMAPWPAADLAVLLEVPADVRRQRVAARDARWRSSVIDRWERQMEPTWRDIAAGEHRFDLILDGERPIDTNAAAIVASLRDSGGY
jgi:uridine kinase